MKKLFTTHIGLWILLISLLPVWSLSTPGQPITHDGPDHVARIANFYQSLSEGNLVPRWAGNLNWGYGHPILMFLYPASSYMASLFHAVGFSFVDSTKLVFAVAFVASMGLFYLWASKEWNKTAGFVGALLYGFAPYRFVDMYVRGAIGEHMAFVFPPVIFLGLLLLARERHKWAPLCIALGTTGLILSHNAISLMVLPVIVLYGAYLFLFESKRKNEFVCWSLFSIGMGFALSAFFWIPAFFEGKYTLRNIVTKGEFSDRFFYWWQFFVMPWSFGGSSELSKEVGIFQWLAVIGSVVFACIHKEKKYRWFIILFAFFFILVLFLMTSWAGFIWNRVTILQNFQFPWRFLTVSVLVSSMLGSVWMSKVKQPYVGVLCLIVLVSSVIISQHMWHAKSYIVRSEEYYSGIYNSTTDTGESSPIWSIRFMEHRPNAPAEVISGSAIITNTKRTSTRHEYTIAATASSRIVENTLYFPGWRILVDGASTDIQFQDPAYRGLMTYQVPTGDHGVVVEFVDTKLRVFSNWVTIAGLGVLMILCGSVIWKKGR
jgi:6-pyruvoyl-tetrahydropterin synthase related domain